MGSAGLSPQLVETSIFTILTIVQSQAQTGGYNCQQLPFLQRTPTRHLLWCLALGCHVPKNHNQTLSQDKYRDLKRAEIVSLIDMNGYNLQNEAWILHYQESAETKGLVFPQNLRVFRVPSALLRMSSHSRGLQQGGELYF